MELVVAGIGQVDPEAGPGAVEDLDGGVNPHLGVPQPLPVNMQVIPRVASMKEYSLGSLDAVGGTVQHEAPGQQDGEDDIRHGGRDPHHLPTGLHPLEEGDVEEAVDDPDADDQLPLWITKVVDSAAILQPQHSKADRWREELVIFYLLFIIYYLLYSLFYFFILI